jgi:hypothetical protein
MDAQLPDINAMTEALEASSRAAAEMSDAQAGLAVQMSRFPQHPMIQEQQIVNILGRIERRLENMDFRMQDMDLRMQANAYNVNCKLANQFICQANVALYPLHHTATNEPIPNFPATLNDIQTERSTLCYYLCPRKLS